MKKRVIAVTTALIVGFISAIALCVQALYAPKSVFSAADTTLKVVIDAGHGGIDGGVVGKTTGVKESDINLAIAFLLKDVLTESGFSVTLTRKTAEGLYGTTAKGFKRRDMEKRREIIENAAPSLVISVHQNYYPSAKSRGAQVFYARENLKSKALAESVQGRLNALYQTEGVKGRKATGGEYFMLSCSTCPSVIVECGFLSSPLDEALLLDGGWKRKIAEGVAGGVMAYFTDFTA